jgi:MFS family permease
VGHESERLGYMLRLVSILLWLWCRWRISNDYHRTAAMENSAAAGRISAREDRLHRGRKVTLTFLMQGWGQLINQIVLVLLLLIFNHGNGDGPYESSVAQYVFRISFAIAAVGTLWLVYHGTCQMPLASHQRKIAKKAINVTGYDTKSLRLTFTHFGSRLFATSGTWFCNDFFFYDNKVVPVGVHFRISHDSTSIVEGWK